MGVLACDRHGCDNIMCDRHSIEFGYICNDCFDELVTLGIVDIEAFMKTEPRSIPILDSYEFYNTIFKDTREED